MKKILSLLITAAIVIGMIAMPVAADDEKNSEQISAIILLQDLGLMSPGEIDPNQSATRATLAEIAVKANGDGVQNTADTPFDDVKSDDALSGYVLRALETGLMNGYSDKRFEPNGIVSESQVIKVMTRLTGYNLMADINGGTDVAYYNAARNANLTDGVSFKNSSCVTMGELAVAVRQALTVDLFEMGSISEGYEEYSSNSGKTILGDRLHLSKISGQITANHFTTLTGASTLGKEQIEINRKIYTIANRKIAEKLGHNVICYIDNDTNVIKAVELKDVYDSELKISSSDIEGIVNGEIKYKNSNGKLNTVKYDKTGYFTYNGVGRLGWSSADLQAIDNGTITLVDSNDDNVYDCVFAVQYEDYIVSKISKNDSTIFFKEAGSIDRIKLDANEKTPKFSLKDADGNVIDVANVKKGCVISVARSTDSTVCLAVTSENSFTGEIVSTDESSVQVGETSYKLNNALRAEIREIKIGKEAVFYTNHLGEITEIDYNVSKLYPYAYLREAGTVNGGLSGQLELKLMLEDGTTAVYSLANRVKVNGESPVNRSALLNDSHIFASDGSTINQLITYKLNEENEISALNFAEDGSAMSRFDRAEVFSKDAHFTTADGATVPNYATRYVGGNWRMFAGKYILKDDCKVFMIPENEEDESLYGVYKHSALTDDTFYEDVAIYDADENYQVSAVVVRAVKGAFVNYYSSVGVVTKVKGIVTADGLETNELTVLCEGAEVKLVPMGADTRVYVDKVITDRASDNVITESYTDNMINFEDLNVGDVIRYNTRNTNQVIAGEVVFRGKSPLTLEYWIHNLNQFMSDTYKDYYYGTSYAAYGQVTDLIDGGIMVTTRGGASLNALSERSHLFPTGAGTRVVKINYAEKTAESASVEDIAPDDNVFVFSSTAAVKLIVVYR